MTPPRNRKAVLVATAVCRAARILLIDLVGDGRQHVVDLCSEESQRNEGGYDDERHDQRVLRETLPSFRGALHTSIVVQ